MNDFEFTEGVSSQHAPNVQNGQLLVDQGDEVLNVEFLVDPVTGSEVALISNPGQATHEVYSTLVDDKIIARFPKHYAAFKGERGETAPLAGRTPLEQANFVPAPIHRELGFRGVHTIEQLASLSDGDVSSLGILNLRSMVDQAREFVNQRPESFVKTLAKENEALSQQVATLTEQVQALLQAQADKPEPPKPAKSRGPVTVPK